MNTLMDSIATPDDVLWRASRKDDRDAFGQIVGRYQNLICSLAYSRTGDVAGSQDLAQETFVTAWRQLADLRDPALLRSWLCGIVRHLSAGVARTERRRGGPPSRRWCWARSRSPPPRRPLRAPPSPEAHRWGRARSARRERARVRSSVRPPGFRSRGSPRGPWASTPAPNPSGRWWPRASERRWAS